MIDAEIFQHSGTSRRAVRFDSLRLRFSQDNSWQGAAWEFVSGNDVMCLPAEPIEEITAISGRFDVTVIDGQGGRTGPLSVQAAMCGYPSHSFCFLFFIENDELWSGHTVTRSFGKIAVVPFKFDPS